jgi:3-deoxy-D-manno-octulosonic-acid transferase
LRVFLLIYNIVIRVYGAAIRLASLWNPKARLWISGRKDIFMTMKLALESNTRPVVWMHSSSLGEFEQGRFLLENLRLQYPSICIVITFFSPSGYEVMKDYKGADHIFYLPLPTRKNAKKFIGIINPSLVLWIKYDYWYHYLTALKKRNTPLLLISAIFHRHHPFFRWYGPLYKKMLQCFTWLFVQTPESAKRLESIGFRNNVSVNGDTRFDRVIDIAENFRELPLIEKFCGDSSVVVAGSTWPEDEEELDHYANMHPEIKFILAPHEIEEDHLTGIEKLFKHAIRYSQLEKGDASQANTLIIDNMGMLSKLYHYATITYVGGGFGSDGVHNVLEAAVHRKPVIFGPVFNKFTEAIGLLEEGGAFTVDNALELEKILNDLLSNNGLYKECSEAAGKFVYDHRGATQNIMQYIQANRLLIS